MVGMLMSNLRTASASRVLRDGKRETDMEVETVSVYDMQAAREPGRQVKREKSSAARRNPQLNCPESSRACGSGMRHAN